MTDLGVDFRLNGYIAADRDSQFVSRTTGVPVFSGFNIGQATDTLFEVPFSGVDGELGIPLPIFGDHGFKAYAGAYYLEAPGSEDAIGPKIRVQGQLTQAIKGQVEVTDDDVFGTNVTVALMIDFPGGSMKSILTKQPTSMMLSQQVQRQYRVPVEQQVTRVSSVAINPADNNPFHVRHVNNTAAAGGDGSFEAPYSVMPAGVTPATDIIFVNRGDGTSSGMTGGFSLSDTQRLLGEGTAHTYTSTEGTFALPGFTAGTNPLLGGTTNMTGNNVEVAGFRIATVASDVNGNASDDGIFGSGDDFLIRDVDISRARHGINLASATGIGVITDSTITGTTVDGIHVVNSGGTTLDLDIANTTITGVGEDGIDLFVETAATLNVDIDNVTVSGSTNRGLDADVIFFNSTLDINIADSSFSDNTDDGLNVLRRDDSTFVMAIVDSAFDRNGGDGIDIDSRNGRVPNGMVDITTSTMNENAQVGLRLHGEADVTLDVDLTENEINRNRQRGIEMTSVERIVLNGVWTGNEINDNGADAAAGDGDGIFLQSNTNLVLTDNDVLRNFGDGLQVEIFGSANVLLDLNGNRINNNVGHGFDFDSVFGSSALALDVDASAARISQFNSNGVDGMELLSEGDGGFGDSIIATINDTEINFNGGRGVDILTRQDSSTDVHIADAQISGNGEEGVYVVNTSSGTQVQTGSSSVALADDGDLNEIPTTSILIEDSEIDANGASGTLGGVVFRVGTSNGGSADYTDAGGFASDGRGGLRGGLINSNLSGNYGDDLLIETYRSTTNDPASGATWSDTEFDPTGYQTDPLARIDMVFRGNTADAINVIDLGGFYDNADPLFKSRDVDAGDPGPFTAGGARRRNATRLASRTGYAAPVTPGGASDNFLYPGVGDSVLRIESDFSQAGVDILDLGFTPLSVLFPGANITGELPFVWDTGLAPGTVFP